MLSLVLRYRVIAAVLLSILLASGSFAGTGPQNVLIVMNANSKDSLEIGNAYRRARNIPYHQVLTLTTATSFQIPYQTYLDDIETPIRTYLKNQQLTDEITCIVLTRGVPQMISGESVYSTASLLAAMALPKGLPPGSLQSPNPYFNAPDAFSHRVPALKGVYLVTVLDGYQTTDTLKLIAQGVTADATQPDGRFILQGNAQTLANGNELAKFLAIRNIHADVTTAPPQDCRGLIGYFSGGIYSGLGKDYVNACDFRPGAIVDMAQHFSAAPDNFDESASPVLLPVSWFVHAGAAGVHGVVGDAESATFPINAAPQQLLDKYTSGYSLAESFYSAMPYLNSQNVILGDPLCSPYVQRPVISVDMAASPLTGITPIRVTATSPIRGATISRIDAYVDDHFVQTIYEPDRTQVVLYIGEEVVSYTVPRAATRRMLLEGLADAVNKDVILREPDGVFATPSLETSTLVLSARKAGADSNEIPVGLDIETDAAATPGVTGRVDGGWLSGGGQDPTAASAIISFLGRRIKPGDQINMQIQQVHLTYTVPAETTVAVLPGALAELINAAPALQGTDGVVASPGDNGMPYLQLQARQSGEHGNTIAYQVTVTLSAGSLLHAYPETPSLLNGGRDGSAATQTVHFMLGEVTAKGRYLLDTTSLADGYHRLRLVAYDGTLAQAQGSREIPLIVSNLANPPAVKLPETLPPAYAELTIPVNVQDNVTQVGIFVDGQMLGSATAAPFSIHIPLTNLGRGTHDLWAEGTDKDGTRYITPSIPLQVLVPPEVSRITPNYTGLAGGTKHRISGSGFQPNCTVRLAGAPARSVAYLSPSLLEVVADAGQARSGKVEVTNPDGTASAPMVNFEYYQPVVAEMRITPAREVLAPGMKAAFTATCRDQYDFSITPELVWEATGGYISPEGIYTAGTRPGSYTVHASLPDGKASWEVPVTIGPAVMTEGRLDHWLVLGPFPDPDYTALTTAQIPEGTTQPSHGEKSDALQWHSVCAENNYIDLAEGIAKNNNVAAYAHVYVRVPDDYPCALVYGSDDGIRIWLNGEVINTLKVRRAPDQNQDTTQITLRAGWNRLLVKVDQGTGGWGFYMRIKSLDGKPLPDLYYALDCPYPLPPAQPSVVAPDAPTTPKNGEGDVPKEAPPATPAQPENTAPAAVTAEPLPAQ